MPNIPRARHAGYTPTGIPTMFEVPDIVCNDSPQVKLGARQITYTPGGTPILMTGWECCDEVCPDDLTTDPCYDTKPSCYVEVPCWGGLGILRRISLFVANVDNCYSASGKRVRLCYDDVQAKWLGSLGLRGGTLNFEMVCLPGPPPALQLTYKGCGPGIVGSDHDEGTPVLIIDCYDPILFHTDQFVLPHCCACNTDSGSPPYTENAPTVVIWGATNCKKVVTGRHIDFTPSGIPILSKPKPCAWDQVPLVACSGMTCPIAATITGTACSCFNGTYALDYTAGNWVRLGPFSSCAAGVEEIHVICTDLGNGLLRLTVDLICGITGTGTGHIDIHASDLENLDVTLTNVVFSDPGSPPECCASDTFTVRLMRI